MKLLSRMLSFNLIRDGKPGKPGPIIYPMGKWESNVTYTSDENSKPYVEYKGEFYYLNTMKAPVGVDPATDVALNKGNWVYMEKFKAIFTEVLFADFAKLGSFIIFGDYLISQHGVDSSNRPSKEYWKFPNEFTPNLLINAKTGEFEANKAKIIGHIEAKSGHIGGFEIANGRLGSVYNSSDPAGNLSIYENLIRVGDKDGKVVIGCNLIPDIGSFTANATILNKKPNLGHFPVKHSNYGLLIDVSGADRNFGLSSNTPIVAPACINSGVTKVYTGDSSNVLDFSLYNMFLLSFRNNTELSLPTEELLAEMFGLVRFADLPPSFGILASFRNIGTTTVTVMGVRNFSNNVDNFKLAPGDAMLIVGYKSSERTMTYGAVSYNT